MAAVGSSIDFKKPRQKMWGIIKDKTLASLPYGNETTETGSLISSYATNCYEDALEQAHDLLTGTTSMANIQIVEFVPYDFIMTPNV
ncbi:hypothetical protein FDB55_13250 [Clostridium botulinum]|uniref:Uncharacterized protein n=1 Tax=Clostridium botulinum TaxID=1491 RepID=A0A6M0STD7_CLOBO|nr:MULTISPECIES: hypothetical protein [Clostridium]MBY6918186.1 hypothetical protein [Clostridium botulinum]NFA44520.1 hypothetical protein [Clostridium botulinum]NFA44551.1 hypothetical protein [Clostridium botulinum]NFG27721.1 hypothetical protein [Clostridium botulinum]NFL43231.1 hypothetical protein [Clostridium botulinum]